MAKFVNFDSLTNNGKKFLPNLGYTIVKIYKSHPASYIIEHRDWINENIKGEWTVFKIDIPVPGFGYGFKNKEDAMAFKLRWE